MAYYKEVLDQASRKEFEKPPLLDYRLRKHFFDLPAWLQEVIAELGSPVNQVGFLLQLGYFRASGRFFKQRDFRQSDISFISQRILKIADVDLDAYAYSTASRHQQEIMKRLGCLPFESDARILCQNEADALVGKLQKRYLVFGALAEFIRTHRIEVPAYSVMVAVINQAYQQLEAGWTAVLETELTASLKGQLDALLEKQIRRDAIAKTTPYKLTHLKNSPELTRVKTIRENIGDFCYLKGLHQTLRPVVEKLALSDALVEEYARHVKRAHTYQVKEWKDKYLLLICFVEFHYKHLSDVLVDTFLVVMEQNVNQCERAYKQQRLERHEKNLSELSAILANYLSGADLLERMQEVVLNFSRTKEEKLAELAKALRGESVSAFLKLLPTVAQLHAQTRQQVKNEDYYHHIYLGSQKMQIRVSDIVRHVEFVGDQAQSPLLEALAYFQQKDGHLSGNVPLAFLKGPDREAVSPEKKKVNVSLYKSLLFRYLLKGIKNGAVYVNASHLHKSIESYLIPPQEWQGQRLTLLERANLRNAEYWPTVKEQLEKGLTNQFHQTFDHINNGENLWVEKRRDSTLRFKVPVEKETPIAMPDLYPTDRVVSLYEALLTVNRSCDFLSELRPFKEENATRRPDERVFMAGLIAHGCNLTLSRVAKTSKQISQAALETTVNNYFQIENLMKANDCISAFIDKLGISALFKKEAQKTHTSSDGQKFRLTLDSIHANYAYKYFGKDKGVTLYSFIDQSHNLFYSTVFSSKNTEAWYVMDGLMHNEVISSDQHSTDTDGVSTPVFALCYLLGSKFQPRIKSFHQLKLHGIEGLTIEQQTDYIIKAGKNVNTHLIEAQWDNILRLACSIRLNYCKPSLVMKRLNSYALQNPLYQALNELGKLTRTIYLLEYMDDEVLRQRVDQQLNKIESVHTLARAIFYGNNGEIQYTNLEDLYLIESCKRLLMNVVICWNYLYLTTRLIHSTPKERKQLVNAIQRASTVAWKHFNFQGEFNFADDLLRDNMERNLEEILRYQPSLEDIDEHIDSKN